MPTPGLKDVEVMVTVIIISKITGAMPFKLYEKRVAAVNQSFQNSWRTDSRYVLKYENRESCQNRRNQIKSTVVGTIYRGCRVVLYSLLSSKVERITSTLADLSVNSWDNLAKFTITNQSRMK